MASRNPQLQLLERSPLQQLICSGEMQAEAGTAAAGWLIAKAGRHSFAHMVARSEQANLLLSTCSRLSSLNCRSFLRFLHELLLPKAELVEEIFLQQSAFKAVRISKYVAFHQLSAAKLRERLSEQEQGSKHQDPDQTSPVDRLRFLHNLELSFEDNGKVKMLAGRSASPSLL